MDNLNYNYLISPVNPFPKIWKDMEACLDRGIHIYDENENRIMFYSYNMIYVNATMVARQLVKLNIGNGDRVVVSARTSIHFPILWVACFLIGAVPVPLPPREIYFAEHAFRTRIKNIIPFFDKYLCYDNERDDILAVSTEQKIAIELVSIPELFKMAENESVSTEFQSVIPASDDTAFLQFTSGSTSFPKGIMITYKNLLSNVHALCDRWCVDSNRTVFGSWLPLYHDMGLIGSLMTGIFSQSNLVLLPSVLFSKNPMYFMELLSLYKVTVCCMTNFALELILKRYSAEKKYSLALEKLEYMGIGAEPVNITILEKFEKTFFPFGLRKHVVSPGYGLAESTLCVTAADLYFGYRNSFFEGREYPTVGKALCGTSIKIDNPENNPVKAGVIKIKSDSVAKYSLVCGAKKCIVDASGFYNTKDLGYFEADQLVILGRADNMFIINGENFFPHEIEALILNSGVLKRKRVACIGVPSSSQSGNNCNVILVYESRQLTSYEKKKIDDELRCLVLSHLGIAMAEIFTVALKTIPLTTSGKLQHSALKKLYLEGRLEQNIKDEVVIENREIQSTLTE